MSTADRATAAISRLSQITTELNARRELRDRSAAAARAAAGESMAKMGPVAEKVAEHLGELARRQRGAGGWVTQKTLADKEQVFGFEPEDDESAEREYAGFSVPGAIPADQEPDTIGVLAEEDDKPAAPPRREVPAPSARRRAPDEADDDDFSHTSSWLKE
ncbi:MAG TPA: hypothetical protein VGX25_18905 [Actinophytocola sp.]|uniref:hypothetical protein n=1 Tax=Actinophytocola sp. TaxID=1872138 RepID=UPI002DDD8241|nr:hypothetical protein [Actinophytocola sp.]HEV2781456.1 hypothetical protein [Actinophytocola sp.]